MNKQTKKKPEKKKGQWWKLLVVLCGLGFLFFPRRQQIKKNLVEQKNRFALILNEECKYIPEKIENFRKRWFIFWRDFFIPNQNNNHQPHGLSTRYLKAYAVVLVLIKVITVGFLFFTYPTPAILSQKIAQEIFDLTNQSRQAENINILNWNEELTRAAQVKADDMVTNGYFAHISPDGKQPWEWIDKGDYYFLYMGENLAMDFSSARIAHSAFQQSPTHWKNIMNAKYQDMGVGVAVGTINNRETIVLVEFFGAQKQAPTVVPVAQAAETKQVAAASTPIEVNMPTDESAVIPVEPTTEKQVAKPIPSTEQITDQPAATPPTVVESVVNEDINIKTDESLPDSLPAEVIAPQPQELTPEINVPAEVNIADQPIVITSTSQEMSKSLVDYVIIFTRYALLAFLLAFIIMLLINVLVRPHIQHGHMIVQSLGLIALTSTLLLTKFHFVEEILVVMIF